MDQLNGMNDRYEPDQASKNRMLAMGGNAFERSKLLKEINQTGHAVNDTMLYLDTHPTDREALEYLSQCMQRRTAALELFEKKYDSFR